MKKHLHLNWTFVLSASVVIITSLFFVPAQAVDTQIKTDGTLTIRTPLDVHHAPSGATYTITKDNGHYELVNDKGFTVPGHNIFFSFDKFNIGSGDTVHFNLNWFFHNVIARITGGDTTTIDGTLQVDALSGATTRANTFLINPAGIIFGNGSKVDVPGSFYASTASSVNFKNDDRPYNADGTQPNGLSSADPVSFGFLGNETGVLNLDHTTINVLYDKDIALVGGDINITASHLGMKALDNLAPPISHYFVDGIQLLMLATHGAGTVNWSKPDNLAKTTALLDGNIHISNTTIVNAGGDAEEIQLLRGGNILFDNAHIVSTNYGDDCGGFCSDSIPKLFPTSGIDIIATKKLTLDHGSSIESETSFKPVGDVNIRAHSLLIDNHSKITTSSINKADINPDYLPNNITLPPFPVDPQAGNINIMIAADFVARGGAQILSSTKTFGNAGEINITAGSFSLANAIIKSESQSPVNGLIGYATGVDGNIISEIDQNPFPFKMAHPGPVNSANPYQNSSSNPNPDGLSPDPYSAYYPDFFSFRDNGSNLKPGYTTPAHTFNWNDPYSAGTQLQTVNKNAGDAGKITLTATSGDIALTNGSIVSTNIQNGIAKSGTGEIKVTTNSGSVSMDGSTISSTTSGAADAGKVGITALHGSLNMRNAAIITTDTNGSGSAGTIAVKADSVSIRGKAPIPVNDLGRYMEQNFTGIRSIAGAKSGGQNGTININVTGDVTMANGAQVSISNLAKLKPGGANPEPTDINIKASSIYLTNSQIVADSGGDVNASNINITFKDWLKLDPSAISTIALNGNGGAINISGGNFFWLQDSEITTSVLGLKGSGGDIKITSKFLVMDSGFIQANTAAKGAKGGLVNVNVGTLIPSGSAISVGGNEPLQFQPYSGINVIQAAAPDGVKGQVSATTPQLNLSGTLASLIVQSFDPNAISRNLCAIGESSSLAQSGKGGLRRRAKDALISTQSPSTF
ncbi:MAG: filamentous hemagglutinin N-terminal domain-containing protein [Methyloglobulus sp.]|nr:filamentous hemagglutinin N-terminal domain-containing protein [Methyloglobulus sp.]